MSSVILISEGRHTLVRLKGKHGIVSKFGFNSDSTNDEYRTSNYNNIDLDIPSNGEGIEEEPELIRTYSLK